jgi:hypothetical protein
MMVIPVKEFVKKYSNILMIKVHINLVIIDYSESSNENFIIKLLITYYFYTNHFKILNRWKIENIFKKSNKKNHFRTYS